MSTENPQAKAITERFQKLRQKRQGFDSLAQEIAQYIVPHRLPGLTGTVSSPTSADFARLFDTTAVYGNKTLASGQVAWMCPQETPWFEYAPQDDDEEAKLWLSKITDAVREELAVCKFYTSIHENFLDRGGFGTCCLYVEEGKKNLFNVQHWPFGTYVIDEDDEGDVDTVIREFKMTARQAVQKFGEEKVSEKVRECLKDAAKCNEEHTYLHAIYPRADAERDKVKLDGENKPIASVYLDVANSHICRVGGYDEMPCMVSRFLEWGSAINGLYGWAPAYEALPDARQTNFLEKMGDALAEKEAFPPMIASDEYEGEIDANANGVTYASAELIRSGVVPKELQSRGRYDILVDRVERRQKAIERAFFVDMFQMFAVLDKPMTAREVAERSSEKLIQFSPTFARLTCELFNPLLQRLLGIFIRSGRAGEVPTSLQGRPYRVQYSSKVALALRALPAIGYHRSIERVSAVAAFNPEVADIYNWEKAERDTALGDGVPAEFLRKPEEIKAIRDARAAQLAKQQQMEQALAGAQAMAAVGKIPGDSPVGNALKANLPQAA